MKAASTLGFNNVLSHLSVVQSGVFLWSPCDPIFFLAEGQVVLQSCARPDASDFLLPLCLRLFVRAACV